MHRADVKVAAGLVLDLIHHGNTIRILIQNAYDEQHDLFQFSQVRSFHNRYIKIIPNYSRFNTSAGLLLADRMA